MAINLNNLFNSLSKNSKMGDFQDLDHIDGLSVSTTCANLYSEKRDDLVMFYFRKGATHASVYTQSKLISENIKWNLKINKKKIKALLVNTRNANAFTGKDGFKGLKILAEEFRDLFIFLIILVFNIPGSVTINGFFIFKISQAF